MILAVSWSSPSSDTTWPVKDLDENDTDSSGIVFHGTNVKTEWWFDILKIIIIVLYAYS